MIIIGTPGAPVTLLDNACPIRFPHMTVGATSFDWGIIAGTVLERHFPPLAWAAARALSNLSFSCFSWRHVGHQCPRCTLLGVDCQTWFFLQRQSNFWCAFRYSLETHAPPCRRASFCMAPSPKRRGSGFISGSFMDRYLSQKTEESYATMSGLQCVICATCAAH